MPLSLNVLGIAGSLREDSYNRALLRATRSLAPEGMAIQIFDLSAIPLYNADLDVDERRPEPVVAFKRAIEEADALLIATPEYNYSIPGVLKNAIDWASRPGYKSVLVRKPVAIIGASKSVAGTARAQGQLKQVLLAVLAAVLPHPEVLVARAKEKFDEKGQLTDRTTEESVKALLNALRDWALRFRNEQEPA